MAQRVLEAQLRFILDRQSLQEVKSGAKSVEGALKGVQEQLDKTEAKLNQIRDFSGYFGDLAGSFAFFGAALGGPLVASAASFVSYAGQANQTSREWLSATDDLQKSYLRIGQVSAQAILPVLETAASIASKVADFAEQNPAAIQAILVGGGTLIGLAAVGEAVEKGIRIYTDAKQLVVAGKQLLAAQIMERAADKQAGAAGAMAGKGGGGALGAVATVGAAAAASFGINELYKSGAGSVFSGIEGLLGKSEEELGGIYQTIKTINTEYGVGIYQAKAWVDMLMGTFNAETGKQQGEQLAQQNQPMFGQEALSAFISFQQANEQAQVAFEERRSQMISRYGEERVRIEQTAEERRTEIVRDFAQQQAEAQDDFNRSQGRALRDFNLNETRAIEQYNQSRLKMVTDARKADLDAELQLTRARQRILGDAAKAAKEAEENYYDQRKKATEQYNKEVQRAEEDHQKQMRRMREDHDLRLQDAIREQDAIAFLREQQNYERERQRAEEDYSDQAQERDADHADQMAEMEEQFKEQRAKQQEALKEQLADLQANYEEQKVQREAQLQEQLAQHQQQFEAERAQRLADFQLRQQDALDDFNLQRERQLQQYQQTLAELDQQKAEELAALSAKHQEELNQLNGQYASEKAAREEAFKEQLNELDAALLNEQETRLKYYELMEKDFTKWLENMRKKMDTTSGPSAGSDSKVPGKAGGGYVGAGLYRLGELGTEFVLNAGATRTAEGMIGGPLTQTNLLAALASGKSGGANLTYSPQYNFDNRADAQQIMGQIMSNVDEMVNKKMTRIERGY